MSKPLRSVLHHELDADVPLLRELSEQLLVSHQLGDAVVDDLAGVDVPNDPPEDLGLVRSRLGGRDELAHADERSRPHARPNLLPFELLAGNSIPKDALLWAMPLRARGVPGHRAAFYLGGEQSANLHRGGEHPCTP